MGKLKLYFFSFFLCAVASADVLLEPIVAFQPVGTSEVNGTGSITGYGMGAKVAYQAFNFFAGMELLANSMRKNSQTIRVNEAGGVVGLNLPGGFRFWGTIVFLCSSQQNRDTNTYDGSGYKLGLGYSPIPFLSLNVEYRYLDFFRKNERELDNSYKLRGLVLSISAPLTF